LTVQAIDWGMGDRASRLVDWQTASAVGARMGGPGQGLTDVERARLGEDFAETVREAQDLVTEFTGLDPAGYRARAWVMSRSEWIDANLRGFQRVLEPLAERVLAHRSTGATVAIRRKGLGFQIGALMGYVSRKVLGQYDLFVPPDDDGVLYFVGPNVVAVERRFRFPRRDFRLWLSLHEVAHRVQFGAVPWLRSFLLGQVDGYLSAVQLDPRQVMEALKHVVEELRTKGGRRGQELILMFMTPEQRAILERIQAMMSLLEGHASFVMDRVGEGRIPAAARMRRGLHERRRSSGLERSFQRLIGFESKIRQYDVGEQFVARVVELAGMAGFNRVWEDQSNLPSMSEVLRPEEWLARVGPVR
jgi:coenzyme F420 biosynthesis associated uncharacterized protein